MSNQKKRLPKPITIRQLTDAVHPSFAFLAGCQLNLFTPLSNEALTAVQLADTLNLNATKLQPLLYALVATELLTVENGRFANTPEAEQYLVRGKPTYMGGMHELLAPMWAAELQTAVSVRTGQPAARHDYHEASEEDSAQVVRGLHAGAVRTAYSLQKRLDFSNVGTLLDVAGGSGGMGITLAEHQPQLEVTIVDLPAIVPTTKQFVARSKAKERIQVEAVDVVAGGINGRYDAAIAQSFIQVLGPADAAQALKNVGQAINPGGRIFVIGSMLDDSRIAPPQPVAFNLVFLNIYEAGEAYTEQQYRDWLTNAGFGNITRTVLADGNSMMVGQKII